MKKIFALLLSVAMVASLFASVAFAAAPVAGKINLDKTSAILSGDTYGTFTVSGTITTTAGALINETFTMSMNGKTYTATNGRFSFLIETNVAAPAAYALTAVHATTPANYTITASTFSLLYNVTLNKALDFVYSATAQEVITGVVKNADGTVPGAKAVRLYWLDTNGAPTDTAIANTTTNVNTGSFGFIVNGWNKADKIGLVVDGIVHVKGEVKPVTMTVVAKPNADIVHTVANTILELTLTGGPSTATNLDVKFYKGTEATGTLVTLYNYDVAPFTQPTQTADGKATLKYTSNFPTGAGTYTAVVTAGNFKASTTFAVINPSRITLVDPAASLKEFGVKTNVLEFGPGKIELIETKADGTKDTAASFLYTVYVNGKLAKVGTTTDNFEKVTGGIVNVPATELATVAVQVIAHRTGTNGAKVYDHTYNVPVTGWAVTYDVSKLTVGTKANVTFVVKDKDGNPVNNAEIILTHEDVTGTKRVSALTTNIQNGIYVFKDLEYAKVGTVEVLVQVINDPAKTRAIFEDGIVVVGEKVYTVSSNVGTLLQGKKQKVLLTVSNADGKFIPEALNLYVGGDKQTAPIMTAKDTDSDGLADAVEVELTLTSTKETILRASNASGTKMGEVVIAVVAPKLVATGNLNVTENIKTKLTFKVVDPRTDTALTNKVTLSTNYSTTLYTNDTEDRNLNNEVSGEEAYTVVALASGSDWTQAAKDEKTIAVSLNIALDASTLVSGTFPVKKAALTSTPDTVLIGIPNNMTITYTDGNAKPIVGYEVYLGTDNTTLIAKTNADGQVFYALAQGATTAVKFAGKTDVAAKYTALTVLAGFDSAAPVVTAPATVDGTTAVITIKDNVRVTRLMVNGAEVNFFPMPTVNHVVTVKSGVNTFAVIAMDANYNVVETTVTITSTVAPAFVPVVISIGKANPAIGLDVAAVAKNGRLMVPFRWFGEKILGATVDYTVIGTAEVVTLVKGTTSVELTLNSVIAKVNGVAVTLDVAAYAEGGRTLVPARFLAETFGYSIAWDAATNNVTISK